MRKFASTGLFLFLIAAPAPGLDGSEAIQKLQRRFEKLKTLSARFHKSHYWKLVDQVQEVKGRLVVAKPNRFFLESDVQTVVANGTLAWNFDPANAQVLVSDYRAVEEDSSYEKLLFDLILLGGYEDRFDPTLVEEERVDGRRCHVVVLAPKDRDAYVERVRLWVDRKDWLVRKVEYENINDDRTTYVLTNLKGNKKTKNDVFQFVPPAGVEVVDLR